MCHSPKLFPRAYLQAKMACESSIHREATQEKQKHTEINSHFQKYRSDILPKGKCDGHGVFNESLQNLLWRNSSLAEWSTILIMFAFHYCAATDRPTPFLEKGLLINLDHY